MCVSLFICIWHKTRCLLVKIHILKTSYYRDVKQILSWLERRLSTPGGGKPSLKEIILKSRLIYKERTGEQEQPLFSLDGKSSDHCKVANFIRFLRYLCGEKKFPILSKTSLKDILGAMTMFKSNMRKLGGVKAAKKKVEESGLGDCLFIREENITALFARGDK